MSNSSHNELASQDNRDLFPGKNPEDHYGGKFVVPTSVEVVPLEIPNDPGNEQLSLFGPPVEEDTYEPDFDAIRSSLGDKAPGNAAKAGIKSRAAVSRALDNYDRKLKK